MEWFKHSTGSHDDPDISDAIDEFGPIGYSVFFITLEVYGSEFNHLDSKGWLTISKRFLARKLRLSQGKAEQILNFFSERNRITIKTTDKTISINCPKFIEIVSNWTKRETRKQEDAPTEAPTEAPTAREEEEKKKKKRREEDIKEEGEESPPFPDEIKPPQKLKTKRPFILPDYIPKEIWETYLDVRTKKRAAKTDNALWLIIEELEKIKAQHGQDPVEVLKKSIRSGWIDVYPIKGNDGNGRKHAGIKAWLEEKQNEKTGHNEIRESDGGFIRDI